MEQTRGNLSTPHAATGVTHVSLFLERDLRTHLDLLKPGVDAWVRQQQGSNKRYHNPHSHSRECRCAVGQSVCACNMREGPRWVPELWLNDWALSHTWFVRTTKSCGVGTLTTSVMGLNCPIAPRDHRHKRMGCFCQCHFQAHLREPKDSNTTPSDPEPDIQNSRSTEQTEPCCPSRVCHFPKHVTLYACLIWL